MKILSIGTDRNLFDENSDVRQRVVEYGRLAGEMNIIVFSQKSKVRSQNYPLRARECETSNSKIKISENTFVYSTNSRNRWLYIWDAYKIAKKIISDSKNFNISELSEKKIIEKELSYKLGGIFFEIQNEIGRFCRERQYADALEQKFKQNNINYKREAATEVAGRKSNIADFIVENKILVELKAKPFILKDDYCQTLRYIEANNLELGLLINFRSKYLKPRRVLNYKRYNKSKVNLEHSDENLGISDRFLVSTQDAFECGMVGWLVKRKFRIPLQLQIHTDFLSPYFAGESFLNKIRVRLAKFLIKRADCIRVVSNRIKESLLGVDCQMLGVHVLPIFVDVEKIKNIPVKIDLHKKYSQFDFIILMASRLTKEKNIELAVDVIKEAPKVGLIIVGDGPEKENLKFQISNLKIDKNVIIENVVDFETLVSYYKTADLFLLASNYEGYGRTLFEAAAVGCKIISSDVGGAREILEEENIFEVGNKKDLREKIINAVNGRIKPVRHIIPKTKEEYLKKYKKIWESCAK